MDRVYVIEWVWDSNCDCPDIWTNLTENGVETICDSKESAAEYIVRYIRDVYNMLLKKYENEYKEELPRYKYLAYEGFPYSENHLPTKEEIIQKIDAHDDIVLSEDGTTNMFICEEYSIYKGGRIERNEA